MSLAFVVATLVLHPVLDEEGPVRLVATGLGDEVALWRVDGRIVGVTTEGEAMTVTLPAGNHTVEAQSATPGIWQALARSDPDGVGWTAVPAWYAQHSDRPIPGVEVGFLAGLLVVAAAWASQSKRT